MAALHDERGAHNEKFERRERGRRYKISAAVTFCWQTACGETRQATGISRDISGHGISVISSSIPIPGSSVEITVNLPVPWARTALLRGRGVVVRLHPEFGSPWGFAAAIEFDEELNDDCTERTDCTSTQRFDSSLESRSYLSGAGWHGSGMNPTRTEGGYGYRLGELA